MGAERTEGGRAASLWIRQTARRSRPDAGRGPIGLQAMSSTHEIAHDDVVRTHEDAAANERPPLLVLDPLLAFLDAAGLGEGEPKIAVVGDGHSNVTYAVRRGDAEFVLRRPPRPPLPPSAHDVLREARVISALAGRARVPKVYAVCDDEQVIGAPFYVMEKVDGLVVTDTSLTRSTHWRTAGGSARRWSTRSSSFMPSTGRPQGSRASASRPATSNVRSAGSWACGTSTRRARSTPSRRWRTG